MKLILQLHVLVSSSFKLLSIVLRAALPFCSQCFCTKDVFCLTSEGSELVVKLIEMFADEEGPATQTPRRTRSLARHQSQTPPKPERYQASVEEPPMKKPKVTDAKEPAMKKPKVTDAPEA